MRVALKFFVESVRLALSYPLLGPAAPDLRCENVCDGSDLYYLCDLYPRAPKILKLSPKNT